MIRQEGDLRGFGCRKGFRSDRASPEVLAAFGASLASIEEADASRRITQKYRQPSP